MYMYWYCTRLHNVYTRLSRSRVSRLAITWCAVPCFSKVISVVNYRFSTPIEYGEIRENSLSYFRRFIDHWHCSLPFPLLLPLLDRSDYPFDCTRARARRIPIRDPHSARALSHLRGRSGNAGGPAPGPPDAPHRWPAPNGARAARRCRCEMGRGGSNVARSEYNTRRNESD